MRMKIQQLVTEDSIYINFHPGDYRTEYHLTHNTQFYNIVVDDVKKAFLNYIVNFEYLPSSWIVKPSSWIVKRGCLIKFISWNYKGHFIVVVEVKDYNHET